MSRQIGLQDGAHRMPSEFSAGQMKRVAIAGAFSIKHRILVADELADNPDSENGAAVFALFRAVVCEQGVSVLVTTHNLALGYQADRIVSLRNGRVDREEAGPVHSRLA